MELDQIAGALHERLVREATETRSLAPEAPDAAARIAALVEREAALLGEQERAALQRRLAERSLGLGPLEPLLADPAVEEVMVSGPGRVWVERRGRIEPAAVAFASEAELRHAIERILAPIGRRVDAAEPLCDARLADCSRKSPPTVCSPQTGALQTATQEANVQSNPAAATVLDGYVRVSRKGDRDGERFISPDEQRKAIEAWASANGVRIAKWHEDISRSGGTMARKGLRDAMARVEARATGGIVVARLDRFARTITGGMAAIERIDALGGRVVSVAEHVDPATAAGRMLLGILLLIAQWGRETARESFEVAVRNAAGRGLYAGRPSYGYMKRDDGRVVPDPETAAVRVRILSERAAGRAWMGIARDLTLEGIPTPSGGTRWAYSTLVGLVRSEAVLGVFTGPWDVRVEDAWEPIASRELWERANAVRGARDECRTRQDRAYAGIVRCAACRAAMQRVNGRRKFFSYGCRTAACVGNTISAPRLDAYVDELVNARLAMWRLHAERDDDGTVGRLAAEHARLNTEFEAWRDDTDLRQQIGDADYRAGLAARARKRDDAASDLADARAEQRATSSLPTDLRIQVEDLAWSDRRALAEAAVHAVWVQKSAIRGWKSRGVVESRLLVEFIDDENRHALPSRSQRELGPISWAENA